MNAECLSKKKLDEELQIITTKYDKLKKIHNDTLEKHEKHKLDNSSIDIAKEYQRIKKDKDDLLMVAAKAQEISINYKQLQQKVESMKKIHNLNESKFNNCLQEKEALEKKLKHKSQENLEMEKKITRLEEKILILQEQPNNNESLIKQVINKSENV